MLYVINEKNYIKVGGFYKEVDLSVAGEELVIKPTGKKIEVTLVDNPTAIDMRIHREQLIKSISKEHKDIKSKYYKDKR